MTLDPRRLDRVERQFARRQEEASQSNEPVRVSHIVEFALKILGKVLFPRQASLLKAMTLDVEHMTPYDYSVYSEWGDGFRMDPDADRPQWRGCKGTPGDLLERVERTRAEGRRWFREILLLIGRRGSKGYLAAILGAWQLYVLLTDGDPHERLGVDPTKRISLVVFAGNKPQAIRNVFKDLKGTLMASDWFTPYLGRPTKEVIYVFTQRQLDEGVDTTNRDLALIEIRASETSDLGPRGSAVPVFFLDEFAHVRGAGATSDSVEIYDAAKPATGEFPLDACIITTTSPWDQKGQAWLTYNRARDIDPDTGQAKDPDYLMVQLESDGLYIDFERAPTIEMWPGGPHFVEGLTPKFVFDEARRRDEEANPDTFAVEFRAHWRQSLDAFPARFVDRLWATRDGARLAMASRGILGRTYYAHADPSLSQANFGFSICHVEDDEDGIPHVDYDVIHHWEPSDFPDGIISYRVIGDEIFEYIKAFNISVLTFDNHNSAEIMERLRARVAAAGLPKRCAIFERRPTAELNLEVWELVKTALGHNIVHAPYYELADLELRAVEFHNGRVQIPDSGDVRTRDVADAMVFAFYNALGSQARKVFERLANLPIRAIRGPVPGPNPPPDPRWKSWEAMDPIEKLKHISQPRGDFDPPPGPLGRGPSGPPLKYDPRRRRY